MEGVLSGNIRVTKVYAGATNRDLHIDAPLSNLTIAYEPVGLIAPMIYPIVTVEKETNAYYIWDKGESNRLHQAFRARGTEANRINFAVSSDNYAVKNYALAMDIPLEDIANADAPLQIRESAARRVVSALNLAWEDRLAVTLTSTTNMTSSTALSVDWSQTAAEPVNDIYVGRDAIRKQTGLTPNTIIMGDHAWSRFSKHPDIIEFIRGRGDNTGGGPVSEAQVAAAFGVNRVLVGKGLKTVGLEGQAATFTDIWSTACIVLYVAPAPGLMEPSHGYTFGWNPPGMPGRLAVERYPDQRRKVESVEVHMFQDEKVTGTDLGYLIVGC